MTLQPGMHFGARPNAAAIGWSVVVAMEVNTTLLDA